MFVLLPNAAGRLRKPPRVRKANAACEATFLVRGSDGGVLLGRRRDRNAMIERGNSAANARHAAVAKQGAHPYSPRRSGRGVAQPG